MLGAEGTEKLTEKIKFYLVTNISNYLKCDILDTYVNLKAVLYIYDKLNIHILEQSNFLQSESIFHESVYVFSHFFAISMTTY